MGRVRKGRDEKGEGGKEMKAELDKKKGGVLSNLLSAMVREELCVDLSLPCSSSGAAPPPLLPAL